MLKTLFWVVALSLPILPNLWCIWHARNHAFPAPGEQERWVRVGTFVPVLGGLLYLLIGWRRSMPLPEEAPQTIPTQQEKTNKAADESAP